MRLKASLAPTDSQHVLSDREHCKVQRTLANTLHLCNTCQDMGKGQKN